MPTSINNNTTSSGGKPPAYRDEFFGAKLSFLEGIIGYRFSSEYFSGVYVAKHLNIDKTQFSRQKNGRRPIGDWELSKLIDLYRLNEYELDGQPLDYKLFKQDLDKFEQVLRDARVGTYGGSSAAAARALLLEKARAQSGNLTIKLHRRKQARRAGGFGMAPAESEGVPNFDTSEQVYFKISVPAPGHLYVLSDLIDIEMTCLMPSCFAEDTVVRPGDTRLPLESGFFDVVGPPAYYRLYAIYCSTKIDLPWLHYDETLDEPPTVPEVRLPKLIENLKDIRKACGEFIVATKDYRVLR